MEITINELKSKLNYYLNLAQNEDVYVVQDEKTIREERLAENLTDKENSNFHS